MNKDVSTTDRSLVIRLRDRREDAWNEMVHIYYPLVYSWCQRGGIRHDDIPDIIQDVFQAVARNLNNFRHEKPGDTFRGWLRGITRHKLVDFFRRQEHEATVIGGGGQLEQLAAIPDSLAEEADDHPDDVSLAVHRAMELIQPEFEPNTWRAFWQVQMEHRTPAEVAESLKMTPNAVYKAKARVLHRLRIQLGDLQT
ncbi:MAG: sigma-70 family RNA polymerase sigma factor [Planctomycetaceae bacterium]